MASSDTWPFRYPRYLSSIQSVISRETRPVSIVHFINPEPASPDHSVPSQSKTATLGDNARRAANNYAVLKRSTATASLTKFTQLFYAVTFHVFFLILIVPVAD